MIFFWSLETWKPELVVQAHSGLCSGMPWTGSGNLMTTGSDKRMKIWKFDREDLFAHQSNIRPSNVTSETENEAPTAVQEYITMGLQRASIMPTEIYLFLRSRRME